MERIGLMGGSFNPVHRGHVNLAKTALASGRVDRILFLPTGNPPHKRAGLADKHDRYEMTRLAIAGEAQMDVSREEIDREGVIYTVDTLAALNEKMPGCELVYLIGADTLFQLETWRRPQDVVRLCSMLVMMRPGEDEARVRECAAQWNARGAHIELMEGAQDGMSSSEIRRLLAAGESISGLVPPVVEAYIRTHGLYR